MLSNLPPDALSPGAGETCGLILEDGAFVTVDNIHPEPVKGFVMDPKGLLQHVEQAVATWHTHPGRDPNLSQEDMAGFRQWPRLTHHIFGIRDGEPTVATFKVLEDGTVVSA
jgi:proteasome lid subunit RPN8/RPN11